MLIARMQAKSLTDAEKAFLQEHRSAHYSLVYRVCALTDVLLAELISLGTHRISRDSLKSAARAPSDMQHHCG